jgi:hypothetical protein
VVSGAASTVADLPVAVLVSQDAVELADSAVARRM